MAYEQIFHAKCPACGLEMSGSCESIHGGTIHWLWCEGCRDIEGAMEPQPPGGWGREASRWVSPACKRCGKQRASNNPVDFEGPNAKCWRCGAAVKFSWQLYWD